MVFSHKANGSQRTRASVSALSKKRHLVAHPEAGGLGEGHGTQDSSQGGQSASSHTSCDQEDRGPHNDCASVTTEPQRGFIFDLGLRECHVFPLTHTRLPKLKASLKNL